MHRAVFYWQTSIFYKFISKITSKGPQEPLQTFKVFLRATQWAPKSTKTTVGRSLFIHNFYILNKEKRDSVFFLPVGYTFSKNSVEWLDGKKKRKSPFFQPVGWIQGWSTQTYVWKSLLDRWMGRKKMGQCFFFGLLDGLETGQI